MTQELVEINVTEDADEIITKEHNGAQGSNFVNFLIVVRPRIDTSMVQDKGVAINAIFIQGKEKFTCVDYGQKL